MTLTVAPALEREMKRYRNAHYEFLARNIAFTDRVQSDLGAAQQGVIVDSVTDGGWAALGHLESQDILLTVGSKPVENVDTLATIMQHIAEDKPACVVVKVKRGTSILFLEWRAIWDRPDDGKAPLDTT